MTLQHGGAGDVLDTGLVDDGTTANASGSSGIIPVGDTSGGSPTALQELMSFDLRPITNLNGSAYRIVESQLSLDVCPNTAGQTIDVHQATAPWDATTVSWASYGEQLVATPFASFSAGAENAYPDCIGTGPNNARVDMTAMVSGWLNRSIPPDGILMEQTPVAGVEAAVLSSSYPSMTLSPELFVEFLVTCVTGTADCNDDGLDGCETDITTTQNCGACGNVCPGVANASATCQSGVCGFSCDAGYADCGGVCMNVETDPSNCGGCGDVCAAGDTCQNGACQASTVTCGANAVYTITSVSSPPLVNLYDDCGDTVPYNGCNGAYGFTWNDTLGSAVSAVTVSFEQGLSCAGQSARTTTLNGVASTGYFEAADACTCNPPAQPLTTLSLPVGPYNVGGQNTFLVTNPISCEGLQGDGGVLATITVSSQVTTTLATDPQNCGACGHVCSYPNGTAACVAGACQLAACNAGFADCNRADFDGCETSLETDLRNCGACRNTCPQPAHGSATCGGGVCGIDCDAGYVDEGGACIPIPGYPLPAGAVSWFKAESNYVDLLGANTAAPTGTVSFTAGEVGQAFLLDGASNADVVSSTTNGFPTGSADRTVEGWFRFDDISLRQEQAIFSYGGGGSFAHIGASFTVGITSGQLNLSVVGNALGGPFVTQGQIYHFAAVSSSGTLLLYVNGALYSTKSYTLNTTAGTTLTIGADPQDDFYYGSTAMAGFVDELTVYDRALAAGEIQGIFAAGSAGKTQ